MEKYKGAKRFLYGVRPFVSDNFYIFFVILSFLSVRFSFPSFVRSVMWVLLVLVNIPLVTRRNGKIDVLIYIYITLGLFSIFGWFQREYPIEFFFTILFESYIPIIFYFIGRESSEKVSTFYLRTLYAFLFVNIAGIVFMITTPGWYVERSLEVLNQLGYYTEDTLKYARFASFLDSYHTSNFSVYMLCISIGGYYFLYDNLWARLLFMFSFIVAIIGILLAQQRVAMLVGIALIPFGMIMMGRFNKNSKNASVRLSVSIVIGVIVIITLANHFADYFSAEGVLGRLSEESRDRMVGSRSNTWLNAIMNQRNFIFGHGLGGGGHLAQSIGITPTVRDGSYFVILLETGIFSIMFFLFILVSSLIRGYKKAKNNFIDFCILIFCCFSLIGANIIYYPYIIGIMWYTIGRINRKNNKVDNYGRIG